MRLVVFFLDDQRYAFHFKVVERITRSVEVTPLPKAPGIVMGIINLGGRLVPVLNIRKRFRLPEQKIDLHKQFIIANTSKRSVAMPADSVVGVTDIAEEEISGASEILPALQYIEGVARLRDGMILIHDLEAFLSLEEDEAIGEAIGKTGG